MLREIFPLFHAEKIRKPLLVIQGVNDPRVPKDRTDALVETVRKNGVPIDSFVSTKSEEETPVRILSFLDQHLRRRQ
ncbi:hypothetical protein BHS09_30685 [Myxococcus xanthus]|uniref:Peptidase S9 prolyl oligopeptidase catalytic domain-containing protein n=2 Tax=Myxococcus xanthus TaxID=34 RepID=A0AAE6G4X9_MYXXA|nr:hypothetical protein BHS09_30685 [Myxococcus xanthus]QDE78276.1 hypothetical protein BHS08_30705 [Myxococcus xanthus]